MIEITIVKEIVGVGINFGPCCNNCSAMVSKATVINGEFFICDKCLELPASNLIERIQEYNNHIKELTEIEDESR